MKTLMRNGRDRRSENPLCATRAKSACSCLGPISGSHQGPRPQRLHSEAGYMAAPERFAQTSNFPLAPRAPSIHGPISKQGDRYLRRLLVIGAHSVLRRAKQSPQNYPWLTQLLARRPFKVVAVALANKMARVAWALLARGSTYRVPQLAAA